jgi:hypothetical protein
LSVVILGAALPSTTTAQSLADSARFLGGAAIGLGLHESAHIVADAAFGTSVGLKKVTFGPLPFFAITHEPVTLAREFIISSAGFWTQHATSELVLTRHPDLRHEHAPVLKGLLAFNVLASVAYSAAAFARIGPAERDTRGMAVSADVGEPVIAALIVAPAALDAARYYGHRSRWIVWGSRAAKIGGALLVVKAAN